MNRRTGRGAILDDRDLGIHTAHVQPIDQLSVVGGGRAHANRYEPTPYGVVEALLDITGIDPREYSFMDLGSGKGRVLCLAAGQPFRRVIGVELAAELHDQAVANLAALPASWRRARCAVSVHADASNVDIPDGPFVLFLFNPFSASVVSRVLDRAAASLAADPRPAWLLYYYPMCADLVEEAGLWALHATGERWGIWRAQGWAE